jgi:hypothetical protein
MATLNTLLVNGDSAGGPRNWASQAFGSIDEGIAGADGTAIGDNTNANATLDTSFLLSEVNADFGNMDTLLWQVRRRVIGAQTNTRSLLIRIVKEADGAVLAAADSGGTFQSVEDGITNTTFDNGTATAFTFVDTSATKDDWNDGRVEVRLVIVKSMAGDANGVEVDTLELTGTYTEEAVSYTMQAEKGSFLLDGKDAGLLAGRLLQSETGSFLLDGKDTNLLAGHRLNLETGNFTLSGKDANFLVGRVLLAEKGSFVLDGKDADLLTDVGYTLTAEKGSFTVSGKDSSLLAGRKVEAEKGSFILAGKDVNLLQGKLLSSEKGSFALDGKDSSLLAGRVLQSEAGNFTLSGKDVSFSVDYVLLAEKGSFVVDGKNADLITEGNIILSAEKGSFTLSGKQANLLQGKLLEGEKGNFSLEGKQVNLLAGKKLNASKGSFTLTGKDADLIYTPSGAYVLQAEKGSFIVSGKQVSFFHSGITQEPLRLRLTIPGQLALNAKTKNSINLTVEI